MEKFRIMATTTFGLEAVAKREITDLGFEDITVSDGYVEFSGTAEDVVKANLWLRTADKILIVLNRFKAMTFEDLFQGINSIKWENLMPENAKFVVTGKSFKSQLSSVPACQSISEKAVIKAMQRKYKIAHFPKDGDEYTIQVALLKDIVTVTLNTSGPSLHKRGYRQMTVKAPITETLASALIMLTPWKKDRSLVDPFCGSGTFPIEAAMMAADIAPGMNRSFLAEDWKHVVPRRCWYEAVEEAQDRVNLKIETDIQGYDIDAEALKAARANAKMAGVESLIHFQQRPLSELSHPKKYGFIVSNPPYGERLEEKSHLPALYTEIGDRFRELDSWSMYLITSYEDTEKYIGRKADKNRKIYNGMLKTYYYQFLGPKPPKGNHQERKE